MQKVALMKRVCCLLLLALAALPAVAQPIKTSLLWEINGNGLRQPSWLFGTFHILCKSDFAVSDLLKDKINASQQFYGEIDLDDPKLQMQFAMKMMMIDKTLSSLMPEADYQKLKDGFQKIVGMPIEMFNHFKPFVPLSILAISSISCDDKIQPETEFVKLAKQNNLPILGLETIDDQVSAIDKEPLDSQINSLKQTLGNFDSVKTVMSKLVAVYKLRDIDSMYAFMKRMGATDDFELELLTKRNRNWIPVIQKATADKSSFIAVGAGHLGGPEGLISLLRREGYRVTPVLY